MMLLCDLISLRVVIVVVVLPVELDEFGNAATETQAEADCFVKALFIEHWENSWKSVIKIACISVRLR